jgi:hypothetical protein
LPYFVIREFVVQRLQLNDDRTLHVVVNIQQAHGAVVKVDLDNLSSS